MNLFDVYPLYDIEPVKGAGSYVFTADGSRYLDFYGGHAVISIGHAHPHYVKAVSEQVAKLGFYSNSVQNSLQKEFAAKLGKVSGYDNFELFLCNSGAEANENAVKLASFHTGRSRVLAFGKAFHGRTSGAVAMTDNPKIVAPFNQTSNVVFSPLNDLKAAETLLQEGDFAAVIVEGIQGVAGIRVPDVDFMQGLRDLTQKLGVVLILDEIQSGYGRTGKFFAHQHYGICPDIITCAKGIANGFPMGAVLVGPQFEARMGMLGTTFGGNHLACAAGIAVLDVIESENLIENAAKTGQYLLDNLKMIPELSDVRGCGLMIGFDVADSASQFRKRLLFEKNIFTGGAGEHTVRLLPALGATIEQADVVLKALKEIV